MQRPPQTATEAPSRQCRSTVDADPCSPRRTNTGRKTRIAKRRKPPAANERWACVAFPTLTHAVIRRLTVGRDCFLHQREEQRMMQRAATKADVPVHLRAPEPAPAAQATASAIANMPKVIPHTPFSSSPQHPACNKSPTDATVPASALCAWLCLQEPAPCVCCTQVKVPKNERIRVCVRKRPINRREISKGEAGAQLDSVCNHCTHTTAPLTHLPSLGRRGS